MSAPTTLKTPRLVLRRPVADDAKAMFETYASDPQVTRYLTWRTHESIERAHTFLRRCDTVWTEGTAFPWIITLDGRLIGIIEARLDDHRAEIGYALARAAWGRGHATEAAQAVVDWALTQSAVRRVWAYVDTENASSARVLEKAGMSREGRVRAWFVPPAFGVPRDCWMYARVKAGHGEASRAPAVADDAAPSGPRLTPPFTLETERLVLRRPTLGDADAVFAVYAKDPEVARYTSWSAHGDATDTRAFLRRCHEMWERGRLFTWSITRRETGTIIGNTDIRPDGHRAEIGYVLGRSAWGRGYATEAVTAVVTWGLAQPSLHRVWAVCDVENVASARVLEKAGMNREACLRAWAAMPAFSVPRDVWCYARVKETA